MVDDGLAAVHRPRLHSQVSKHDINSIALPQIKRLHALIVAVCQVI